MSFEGMRFGGGRCPSLLVGCLSVICLMLIINWYTLSSENLELLRQIDDLTAQLKISGEERDGCVTMRDNLEQHTKELQDKIGTLNVMMQKQKDEMEMSLTVCNSELDSLKKLDATRSETLKAVRFEKDKISALNDEKGKENDNLLKELNAVKRELETVRLSLETPKAKKYEDATPKTTGGVLSKGQLGPVPISAVEISQSGRRAQIEFNSKISVGIATEQKSQQNREAMNIITEDDKTPLDAGNGGKEGDKKIRKLVQKIQ